MAKYALKIFDNETGKLVMALDFNVIIAGLAGITPPEGKKPREGEAVSSSMCLCTGTLEEIACALTSVDNAQEAIIANDPMIGIAYMMNKKEHVRSEVVHETPYRKVRTEEAGGEEQ